MAISSMPPSGRRSSPPPIASPHHAHHHSRQQQGERGKEDGPGFRQGRARIIGEEWAQGGQGKCPTRRSLSGHAERQRRDQEARPQVDEDLPDTRRAIVVDTGEFEAESEVGGVSGQAEIGRNNSLAERYSVDVLLQPGLGEVAVDQRIGGGQKEVA
jgi:hypothetical protein